MESGGATPPDDLPIEAKVSFLRRPEAYPERPRRVEVVETHMSWIFLTDEHAYKLKKPVRSAHFDFRDLSARRYNCLEEVRLNRPLAPTVYLRVPLTIGRAGILALECGRLGAPQVGPILFDTYQAATGDEPAPVLIAFYTVFRALVRVGLAAAHIDDPSIGDPEKWRRRAVDYLGAGLRSTALF